MRIQKIGNNNFNFTFMKKEGAASSAPPLGVQS